MRKFLFEPAPFDLPLTCLVGIGSAGSGAIVARRNAPLDSIARIRGRIHGAHVGGNADDLI